MATYYLLNAVTVGTTRMTPGDLVDDAVDDTTAIQNAGGVLYPSYVSAVATAATQCAAKKAYRGANESELEAIMFAAAHKGSVTDATTSEASIPIPLTSFLDADGDPLVKFVNAASPTFGFALVDSEALCLRWNNDASPGTALCQVTLPEDLDADAAMVLEFLCSKTGATVGDATTLTITAFLTAPGALHDADADAGGVTGALVGNAAAKTTALLSRTIAAADIPDGAHTMTFTVTPTAGTLGTDDLCLHAVRLRYKRKMRTV